MDRTDFEQWKGREVARLLTLVETERRYYQEMVAALPVALAVLSPDRSVVSANRAFRQLFGVTIDEIRNKSVEQLIPSDRLIESIRDLHVNAVARPPFVVEAGTRMYRIAIVPIRNWNEDMELETLLMVQDANGVQEHHRTAADVHQGAPGVPQNLFRGALEHRLGEAVPEAPAQEGPAGFPVETLPAIVWQADAATLAFTAVGGAAETMLGYPASHWIDTPGFLTDRIHTDDRDATLDLYKSIFDRGGEATAEFRAITKSGEIIWCRETILAPAPSPENQERKISGVLNGIRQRKQLEQQLVTSERHAALTGISARLAHDLNNPLMIITGYSEEMLQGFRPDDPRRADLEQILAATQRIESLTSQLLQFTRRPVANLEPLNLAAELLGLEDKLAQAAGETTALTITAPAPVWAQADADRLEEILTALVSSHLEAAEGRTQLTIDCGTSEIAEKIEGVLDPGAYATVTITDNGKGLTREKRAGLFEALISKEPERPEHSVAHAYALVRQWGGDIAVASEPFRGNRYSILLPQTEAPSAPSRQEPGVAEIVTLVAEPPRPRILVVDDEPGIRALVAKILRRERYEVSEAGSVAEALSIAQSGIVQSDIIQSSAANDIAQNGTKHKGFQLLVTDVMLPDQSGRDLAEQLTQAIPSIKVLYISGFTDNESVRTGEFPPGSMFLQKPFTLGALVGKVKEALQG